MLQKLREKRRDEGGFTLIELLVVVLIIAILAAIAIPIFLNQRKKAYMADVQSTLRNAATAAESYATSNATPGSYAGFGASADLTDVRESSTQTLSATDSATDYCITVVDTRLAGDAWGTATFDSDVGKPQSADTC
jgi:type IV pilus assembly protein PilA